MIFDLKRHINHLPEKGKILVAPLHWGIGHATRSIPLIKQLIAMGYQPVIASDGAALRVLQHTFPKLVAYELPGYDVRYAKHKSFFTLKLLFQIPKFIKTYKAEKKKTKEIVEKENIVAIISDNRFGVFHKEIRNIYLTHQVRVKSGFSTSITTKLHHKIINKFDYCWVPDVAGLPNLSGELSHNIKLKIPIEYIGFLSQFEKEILPIKYDVLVLLSGPEPQRTQLEDEVFAKYRNSTQNICFVKGVIKGDSRKTQEGNLVVYSYLLGKKLQDVINQSELIIARSGYSTVMDLAVLQKKAVLIPTPGQAEQMYLATYLKDVDWSKNLLY